MSSTTSPIVRAKANENTIKELAKSRAQQFENYKNGSNSINNIRMGDENMSEEEADQLAIAIIMSQEENNTMLMVTNCCRKGSQSMTKI